MSGTRPIRRDSSQQPNIAKLPTVTATELKNKLGEVLGGSQFHGVAVTRHNRPEFVVLPAATYENLMQKMSLPLAGLSAEFDALVASMNTPKAKRAYDALFGATQAAVAKGTEEQSASNG